MTMQFPHCDSRVLHAPGTCRYCDKHDDWQTLREAWGISFTGESVEGLTPCPADAARPPGTVSDHRRWAGNVATSAEPVNETIASQVMYGNWPQFDDDASVDGPCDYNHKRGWHCSRGRGHDGPCALTQVPLWKRILRGNR